MDQFSFAIVLGDDDVIIFSNPTLKLLGIDVSDSLNFTKVIPDGLETKHAVSYTHLTLPTIHLV